MDIGANPSAEGGDDEGVENSKQKVVDLIDAFRLNVRCYQSLIAVCSCNMASAII